ncbi:hypothetical protein AQUCO_04200076v1 [Aquilegia coerulea]|uniref:Uncharacterized protein n=1 Tax=Aquilegia coerulea TaxID=218851 RepID=A0A2G5CPG1_AQUCA|nr:hypothetical protein AQUCO_04200076v1 [Aquilegia coerulea]
MYNASNCIGISVSSNGLFRSDNPLYYSTPLFLLQSSLATLMTCLTSALLTPLGIPAMVAQVLAGISLGPTFLGHIDSFTRNIFPNRGYIVLETFGGIGTIFQIFLIGVQMDAALLLKPGRKALIIGIVVVFVPLTFVSICVLIVSKIIGPENQPSSYLYVGAIESMSSFPIIAGFLVELNILNTECSYLAFCSSMVSGILSFIIAAGILFYRQSAYTFWAVIPMLFGYGIITVVILYLMQPIIKWMIKKTPDGQAMRQGHLIVVYGLLMMITIISKQFNAEILFGPFLLGMIIPSGPPLGSILIEKCNFINKWMIMPIFYSVHGTLLDDMLKVPTTANLLIILIVFVSFVGKFMGAFLPALHFNLSYKDSCLIGLAMNAQGFVEILLFAGMKEHQFIDDDSFNVMFVTMVILNAASAPLVRYLHRSSMKYILDNKRTIQHLKPNNELRILGCVYQEDNVPSMIHFLKAINPTNESPIHLTIIHFVELAGRATPLIISHNVHRNLPAAAAVSERIVNVFKCYEENNKAGLSTHPYTVVSHYPSMYHDVCMLAFNKRTSLIVLPYHKNLVSGQVDLGMKRVNCDVLQKSPCSVAILIDRGLLGGIRFIFTNWVSYHVLVVFLGGPDDREALAHGKRMSENPTIRLTVIRFLTTKGKDGDPTERCHDDAMINIFNFETAYNDRVTYMEEKVEKGVGVIKVFESMAEKYELIILGRRHDEKLRLIIELTDWNRCSEVGTLGDIFTTSGYGGKATLMVVQQQSKLAVRSQSYQDEESQASYDVER